MKRFLVAVSAVTLGLFALVFSLLMAIPLMIMAFITGKKLQKDFNKSSFNAGQERVIEGEYKDISSK
ncbi:hypothetical protein [Vibrio algarum]|uniref:Hydroxylamine reductase n=1 Tax=Vibrio algarum TaxID=3020714 RepID=A0ABT4YX80_9VIBR|nr:hypothetical protein [Vibrio sp. KJ40-1]MDB1126108.1 hypothetical protein [Vibrio sp. KJ40-1]